MPFAVAHKILARLLERQVISGYRVRVGIEILLGRRQLLRADDIVDVESLRLKV